VTETAAPPARSRAGPLRWRRWLPRAVFESLLIVLSVFLALALDQWRSERETHQRVQEARAYLAQEVRANRTAVMEPTALAYHRKIRGLLTEILQSEQPDPALMQRYQAEFSGVRPFNPQDVVWSSVSTGDLAQNLPYSELFLLARISAEQAQLQELHRALFNALLAPSADAEDPAFQRSQADTLRTYLGDVVPAEERLIKLYDEALKMLPPASATNT
jgi:hypothetical protein